MAVLSSGFEKLLLCIYISYKEPQHGHILIINRGGGNQRNQIQILLVATTKASKKIDIRIIYVVDMHVMGFVAALAPKWPTGDCNNVLEVQPN